MFASGCLRDIHNKISFFAAIVKPIWDYLALADEFDVVIVRDVPRLDLFLMNSMIKRFIIMIDQIYDNHVSINMINKNRRGILKSI